MVLMAPKAKVSTEKIIVKTPVLDELNLEIDAPVRFRRKTEEHWTTGKIKGDSKDGSLSIVDKDGRWRSIMPEHVELLMRGPRGGKLWKAIVSVK